MDEKQQAQEEKRELRRKRRVRNQILAYGALIILILVAAVGIVWGVQQVTETARREEEQQQSSQELIENMLGDEEDIQMPSPTPEPSPVVVEKTPEEKLDEIVNAGIEVMPLEDKVAGLFIVTPEAITGVSRVVQAGEGTQQALSQYAVGGLVYFSQNIRSKEQLAEMLNNTRLYTKYPIFLAVDEEGGSVARVASAGIGEAVDSAQVIGETGDPNNAYQAGVTIGESLSSLGFNLDFAPVADISSVENSVMGDRTYGSDPQTAAPYVIAMMQGLNDQDVTACLKHFPGNGATIQDPHSGLAVSDRTEEQFKAEEFTVFQAGIDAGAKMIMISHMAAPALTGNNDSCAFSEALITDILRGEMGFDGVIITDALNMNAVTDYYTADEAAIQALLAGCDMLLMPEDFELAYEGVLQAVKDGVISEERIDDCLRRIYRIKYAGRIE